MNRWSQWIAGGALAAFAAALIVFGWWSISLVNRVQELRGEVSQRVGWLRDVESVRESVRRARSTEALLRPAQLVGRLGDELEAADRPLLADAANVTEAKLIRLAKAKTPAVPLSERESIEVTLAGLVPGIRRDTASISRDLAEYWDWLTVLVAVSLAMASGVLGLLGYLYFVSLARARETVDTLYRGLKKADRLAAAGTLAAGVAHEVNSPLAALNANLRALRRVSEVGSSQAKAIEDGLLAAKRIESVVGDLRSSLETPSQAEDVLRLRGVVESALELAGERLAGTDVEIDIDDGLAVHGTERLLVRALHNVVVNAGEAMAGQPGRGKVRIAAERVGADVRISVADTGPGMSEDVRLRALEPFVTTKAVGQGTGLGLFSAHNAVASSGGSLKIPATATGTMVSIRLPAAKPTPAAPEPAVGPVRVLIIDDESILAMALARLLDGFDTATVSTAAGGLERLREGEFDVVLCDLRMPGMTGIELHAAAVEHDPSIGDRFVFMSGGIADPEILRRLEELPNRCLDKPFGKGELRAALLDAAKN